MKANPTIFNLHKDIIDSQDSNEAKGTRKHNDVKRIGGQSEEEKYILVTYVQKVKIDSKMQLIEL